MSRKQKAFIFMMLPFYVLFLSACGDKSGDNSLHEKSAMLLDKDAIVSYGLTSIQEQKAFKYDKNKTIYALKGDLEHREKSDGKPMGIKEENSGSSKVR